MMVSNKYHIKQNGQIKKLKSICCVKVARIYVGTSMLFCCVSEKKILERHS